MAGEYHLSKWFKSRELYAGGQHFSTFVKLHGHEKLVEELKRLEPNYAKASALEVGPGDYPVLRVAGFGNRTYADVSEANLRQLRLLHDGKGRVVVGSLEALPFADNSFHVAVANEVLTHVEPRRRIDALGELARVAGKLLIVDRCIASRASKSEVEKEKSERPAQAFRTLLSPKKLANRLKRLGYRVRLSFAGFRRTEGGKVENAVWGKKQNPPARDFLLNYFILSAEKRPKRT